MKKHLKQRLALAALPMAVSAMLAAPTAAQADDVEFHGYVRTGVGTTSAGGNQQCFEPGWPVRQKFRLGNECDSYGEAFVGLGFGDQNGAWSKYHLGLAYQPKDKQSYDATGDSNLNLANTENYFEGGGFFESDTLRSAKVWVGKRYLRKDIHISDYYYWNTSGTGAGMEEIGSGDGAKFAVAYMQGGGRSTGASAVVPNWLTAKVYNIPVNTGGKLEMEFVSMQGTTATGSGVGSGQQLLIQHTQADVLGGSNTLALIVGSGAGGSGYEWLPAYWGGTSSAGDDGSSTQVHDILNFSPKGSKWTGQASLSYATIRSGGAAYMAVGVRPQYNFTANKSIAFEISHQEAVTGASKPALDKFTIAPQYTLSTGMFARPVFRAFITHARWNDAAGSGVANGAFGANGRSGTTVGFQAEAWW